MRLILKIIGVIVLAAFAAAILGLVIVAKMARELPSPQQFVAKEVRQSTKIYDRTGRELLYEIHSEEKRTVIPFEEMPDYLKKATIAIEDQNFYEHPAFDLKAMLRAFFVNIIQGKIAQGGSTITQQLAKNAFLSSDRTLTRKIKELILSNWIEQRYSKDEILGLYLNQIPYGSNAYGVEAASRMYFGKPAKDLTLAESALLAALPKAPTYYSPWGPHRDELLQRKNYIIEQMYNLGFIDAEQKKSALNAKLNILDKNIDSIKAPHFVMMVRDYLTGKYGEDAVDAEGLNVITTLDYELQEFAEAAVSDGAKRNAELYEGRNAALVAQDPKTGQILALVGSKNYLGQSEPKNCEEGATCQFEGKFNVASQGLRQPGSAFKPFVYLNAITRGYPPETIVFDLPTEFSQIRSACPLININYLSEDSRCFHPQNFDHNFRGPVSIKDALAQSINVPSVKILYLVGIENAIKTAASLGITTLTEPSRYGLSLVLGGGEVKLIDMVQAYATLARDGERHQQSFILKVTDSEGRVLEEYQDKAEQVLDPQPVRILNEILSDTSARAPLFQNSLNLTFFPDREVALKTGTTNDYKDAWALGYTPSLAVGVWAGNNNNKPMQRKAGSILAAIPIWHAFLEKALIKYPTESFNKPELLTPIEKTMLNGNYTGAGGEIHNILYYVDKDDPLGPPPQNPKEDPQFENWEAPVVEWLKKQIIVSPKNS